MDFRLLLRQVLGFSCAKDVRKLHGPGGGAASLHATHRKICALRIALTLCILTPVAFWAKDVTARSAHFYTRCSEISREFEKLGSHEAHNEILKFYYGDPAGRFYHETRAGFSGGVPPVSCDTAARYPEKLRTVQDIHDYWHEKYSDEMYCRVFKPLLMTALFDRYARFLWKGGRKLPDEWTRDLKPEDLWRISNDIEDRSMLRVRPRIN